MRNGIWLPLTWARTCVCWTATLGAVTECVAADIPIQPAIARGVEYLVRTQTRHGTWDSWGGGGHQLGETALAGLSLLSAGQPKDSPAVARATEAVRRLISASNATYEVSIAIMFLDGLKNPQDAVIIRSLGDRLSTGQCENGSWTYVLPGTGGSSVIGAGGDNSNTQFASLASWISRRHGMQNDNSLQKVDHYFRNNFLGNQSQGGWGYGPVGMATPAMTCAGLVALATHRGATQQRIGRHTAEGSPTSRGRQSELSKLERPAADDPIVRAALAGIGQSLVDANRNQNADINADLYFCWSLERVGMIYGLRKIGGIDWYEWGSHRLLYRKMQAADGHWEGRGKWPYSGSVGTSFAILFLSRTNVAEDLTAQIGAGGGRGMGSGSRTPPGADAPSTGGDGQFMQRIRRPIAAKDPAAASDSPAPAVER